MPPEAVSPGPRAVLLDVDGTLVDTVYVHTICWEQALREHGHTVPMAQIHRSVGMGSDQLLDHLLGVDRDKGRDDSVVSAHDARFSGWYEQVVPLLGARELVRECARRDLLVVLASSGSARDLEAMRAALDSDEHIAAVTTSADAEASKPAPDILAVALDRVGASAERAVFIGDAVWDVKASSRVGLACIGLECGGTSAAELMRAGAIETWRDPADLLANLDRSAVSRLLG